MKKHTKIIIAAITLLTMLPFMVLPTSAMQPHVTYYTGGDAMGVEMPRDSGAIIKNQSITFDIPEFPVIDNEKALADYSGSVTTEYMLYNPTDSEITLKVSYPIGRSPNYHAYTPVDPAKHVFKLNGEVMNPELRYLGSYSPSFDTADAATFASLVSDEYIENEYCNRNTTVTKYTFYPTDDYEMDYFAFEIDDDLLDGTVIYYPYLHSFSRKNGSTRFYMDSVAYTFSFDIYVIGNDLESFPQWRVYDLPYDDEAIEGEIKFHSKEKMTLSEFIFDNYDESVGISEVDFYNIAAKKVTYGLKNDTKTVSLGNIQGGYAFDTSLGFVYEISLKPGESASHSICTPLYPSVETKFEPHTYDYRYVISYNNATMLENEIAVKVNTPYCLLAGEGFEKTDSGYSLTLDANEILPENTYRFDIFLTLCEVENPEEVERDYSGLAILLIIVAIVVMPFLLIKEAIDYVVNGVKSIIQWLKGDK